MKKEIRRAKGGRRLASAPARSVLVISSVCVWLMLLLTALALRPAVAGSQPGSAKHLQEMKLEVFSLYEARQTIEAFLKVGQDQEYIFLYTDSGEILAPARRSFYANYLNVRVVMGRITREQADKYLARTDKFKPVTMENLKTTLRDIELRIQALKDQGAAIHRQVGKPSGL